MDYNNLELYHYGVKGMKWGVRKSQSGSTTGNKTPSKQTSTKKKTTTGQKIGKVVAKRVEKSREKAEARKKSYEKTTDWFGVGGAAMRSYGEYQRKKAVKGMAANMINASANQFILSRKGGYYVNRGVDFARRAAVGSLSMSARIDQINAYANVARAYMYQTSKS